MNVRRLAVLAAIVAGIFAWGLSGSNAFAPSERTCKLYGSDGPYFVLDGVVMHPVDFDDRELVEQRQTCNHYMHSDALVTPDCRVHYDHDHSGMRIPQIEPPLSVDGTCRFREDVATRLPVLPPCFQTLTTLTAAIVTPATPIAECRPTASVPR